MEAAEQEALVRTVRGLMTARHMVALLDASQRKDDLARARAGLKFELDAALWRLRGVLGELAPEGQASPPQLPDDEELDQPSLFP